ncbi:MAG: 50S ribosomal protein L24 [Candidatus Diapherotrites archaeon]
MAKSKKPEKQRKEIAELPLHKRKKLVTAHLSKELREELKRRSLPVRKGDVVKIMRGSFKGKSGKVTKVDLRKGVVYIEKIVRKKANGTEIPVPIRASKLLITSLDRSDEKRFKRLKQR